jgi:hypothetical protein
MMAKFCCAQFLRLSLFILSEFRKLDRNVLKIISAVWSVFVVNCSAAIAQTAEEYIATAQKRLSAVRCVKANDEDITVCGRSTNDQGYRLPLPSERDGNAQFARRKGELPPPTTDAKPWVECGIFQGQRRCNKRDAAHYGYGKGRDPLTVASKVIDSIINPDR